MCVYNLRFVDVSSENGIVRPQTYHTMSALQVQLQLTFIFCIALMLKASRTRFHLASVSHVVILVVIMLLVNSAPRAERTSNFVQQLI